jgi:heterodisulfide reductase subunit C
MESVQTITSGSKLAEAVMAESGQNVNLCFQCGKCAAGCPLSYAMDYTPAQLIHAIRLGMDDLVFKSTTMWLCATCETCTTRCPQEVDVAKVMDAVKIIAVRQGVKPTIPQIAKFYRAVLTNVRMCGRMYEMGMIAYYKMLTFEFLKDMKLGMKMFRKNKLKLIPSFTGMTRTWKIFSRVKKIEKRNLNT